MPDNLCCLLSEQYEAIQKFTRAPRTVKHGSCARIRVDIVLASAGDEIACIWKEDSSISALFYQVSLEGTPDIDLVNMLWELFVTSQKNMASRKI